MAIQEINVGTVPNDRTGDTWRAAMEKVNSNFSITSSNSVVYINEESDLPNVAGGASTLEPNTKYIFRSGLILSTRLVFSAGTSMEGVTTLGQGVTYTGVSTFITGNNVSAEIRNIEITASNCPQVIEWTGDLTANYSLIGEGVVIRDCQKVGTFNSSIPLFSRFIFFDFEDGVTLTGGPIIGGSFTEGLMQDVTGTAVHIDVSDSLLLTFKVNEVVFAGSGTVLSSSIGGANGLNEIQVLVCDFGVIAGSMTPLAGFANGFQTNGWVFALNGPPQDVQPSRYIGETYLTTANTITVLAASTFYEIGVPSSGAWASDILEHFSVGTDGVLTYTGSRPVEGAVDIQASIEKVGGGSDELEVRAAINWTAADPGIVKSGGITQNSTPTSVFCRAIVVLQPGDTIRPIFSNNSNIANIIVNRVRYDFLGM